MDERFSRNVPTWFWIVAIVAVGWEAFGCYIYLSVSMMDDGAREGGYSTMVTWQWSVFAVAVWS